MTLSGKPGKNIKHFKGISVLLVKIWSTDNDDPLCFGCIQTVMQFFC